MKNNRTFLEKLLDGAEVEWKSLGKVTDIKTGQSISKNIIAQNPGVYPVINSGRDPLGFINEWNTEDDPIGITTRGAGVGSITWQEGKYFRGNLNYSVTIKSDYELNVRFLYHMLLHFQKEIHNLCSFTGIPALNASELKKLEIPIPPLSVQTEIVKILDALTALTSELTSELILRQKQYEYYREKLLSEEELEKVGFEWRTLEELVEKTQNIKWKNNTKTYRYIDLTSVDRENNSITGTIEINALNAPSRAQKIVKENDIIFATTRPTQQRIASITKEFSGEIASTGYCVLRANTDIVLPKWLFYFLSTINFKNYVEENQSGSAYPAISDSKVKEFRIPVPEVTIQQSIIEKLDKFYSLTNSLLHGLPKEINNRTKQYSYYQNELLNFLGKGDL
ncbi:TPA: restriction endonuclease subunit S [Haemophilus influenzae]